MSVIILTDIIVKDTIYMVTLSTHPPAKHVHLRGIVDWFLGKRYLDHFFIFNGKFRLKNKIFVNQISQN